ncbi:MAG: endonuclease NucS [Candidatus Margulisbacteria bacterium]|nr:endonuclease NucS [Candidatus Margulisiibacteriota bacterium]
MPINHKIWKIHGHKPEEVHEVAIDERRELEEIIFNDISILNEGWLLIGRQVSTSTNKYIDLLAIDNNGNIIIIELKRDQTPREVVAQVIDYASWVKTLKSENISDIYNKYEEKYLKSGLSFNQAFLNKYGIEVDEENINTSHQMIVVASSLDSSTERIVQYLSESNVPINVMFFKTFKDSNTVFLSRAWLIPPLDVENNVLARSESDPWNGEYYVSFGEFGSRSWDDAVKYGFISAGGGVWYTQTLNYLNPGDRIWVNIPKTGYVGVGIVQESAKRADSVLFYIGGQTKTIYDLPRHGNYHEEYKTNEDDAEYIVKVKWEKTVSKENAVKEIGLFGNQNSVCKPRTDRWTHTINRLKEKWDIRE